MDNKKHSSKSALDADVVEDGVNTFLATLQTPVQFYCIVNDSVKDMHLALNPPHDFSRMNV